MVHISFLSQSSEPTSIPLNTLILMTESAPSSAQRARLNRSTHRQRRAGILRDLLDVFWIWIVAQSERRCEWSCSVCCWADKSLHGVPWSTDVLCVGCRRLAVMNNVLVARPPHKQAHRDRPATDESCLSSLCGDRCTFDIVTITLYHRGA